MFGFKYLEAYKKYVESIQNREIIVFCGGFNASEIIAKYFVHGEVKEIWDNYYPKEGRELLGIPIKRPPEIMKGEGDKYTVIVATYDELALSAITNQLKDMGIENVFPSAVLYFTNIIERYNVDYSKKFHELNTYKIIENNTEKINKVRALLADEKSKYVYDRIVENRKYNIDNYTDVSDDIYDHYFSDGFFEFGSNEVFVDAGAFLGEDTIRLAQYIGKENLKRAYCFEPDISNYFKCIKNLNKYFENEELDISGEVYKGNRFSVIKAGLWNETVDKEFTSYGTHASVFSEIRNDSSAEHVPAVKLDDVINSFEHITCIKMDIEGAEIPALQGASEIICRDKPKLAICIYHMVDDLWKIPLYLHELVPEYKLYIRHHTTKFWDSVVYACI